MSNTVKVSVIIPCYNQGQFVADAVDSVLAQTFSDFEIIIVNDGSTDGDTCRLLKDFKREKVQILHTANHGLATARNNAITDAIGEYILPLDADDRIEPEYLEKAVALLDTHDKLGIVYCRAKLFGNVETEWLLPPYSLQQMLLDNVIFCSSMFRRSDWEAVGGYDPGMIYGWEDYEFWLSLIELGREVLQIPEILFSYRVASDSMVRSKERWQKTEMFKRIFQRHTKLFSENIEVWINALLDLREPYYSSKLYVDTGNGISDSECVVRKIEQTTSTIQFSLADFHGVKGIRFDPVDVPAVLEMSTVTVTDTTGHEFPLVVSEDNAAFVSGKDRYFTTDDPQVFFQTGTHDLSCIQSLTVRLRFKALAAEALQQIVQHQQQLIDSLSKPVPSGDCIEISRGIGKALKKKLQNLTLVSSK